MVMASRKNIRFIDLDLYSNRMSNGTGEKLPYPECDSQAIRDSSPIINLTTGKPIYDIIAISPLSPLSPYLHKYLGCFGWPPILK